MPNGSAVQQSQDTESSSGRFFVELLLPAEAANHEDAWRRLASACLEPNIFFDPDFAVAAANHLGKKRPPRFAFVWRTDGAPRDLVAVFPLLMPRGFFSFEPGSLWVHEQAPLGTPLIHPSCGGEALAAFFAYLESHQARIAALAWPLLPQEGPVARLLISAAERDGRRIEPLVVYRRAILQGAQEPAAYLKSAMSSARRRKLRKARTALQAMGTLAFRITDEDIPGAVESFMAHEASGWKGRRGTALIKSPERAAFARAVALRLGAKDKCLVASLALDKEPIAMALLLRGGGRHFWWKIAYDEAYAGFSPGLLLAEEVTQHLLTDPAFVLADSCTTDDHPMINTIWSDRMTMADYLVSLASSDRFWIDLGYERFRRAVRQRLKAIVVRLRRERERLSKRGKRLRESIPERE